MEMSQELIQIKKFKPHQDLLELTDMIRYLKSEQIAGTFTYGYNSNKRCVTGALAVEYFGSKDNNDDIINVIKDSWVSKFKTIYKVIYDSKEGRTVQKVNLFSKLVSMNDSGRTFDEIANWTELEAYRYGTWI